jgi:hypothetical protein
MKNSENAPRSSGSAARALAAHRQREQGGQHVGIGRRLRQVAVRGRAACRPYQLGQFQGVDQVAVMAERQAGRGCRAERRLGVVPYRRPAGRVPGVPDRDVAAERIEHRCVEDLRHQAHVLEHDDPGAVADRDPGRLLAAVLQRVQAEIGERGHVLVR